MATVLNKVDAVIVGFGWAGAIMAKELTEAGLHVVALERGPMQDTYPEGSYPQVIDELTYSVRKKLFVDVSKETVTVRHSVNDVALPNRQLGAFLPGKGVGGAGLHWSGVHFRVDPVELRLRSHYEERYGRKFIPEGMTIQDFGVSYEELEPYFDFAEKVFGTSGQAWTVNGQVVGEGKGGNPYAPDRSNPFPLPAQKNVVSARLFEKAATSLGYKPYNLPSANTSGPYTNPYGAQMGPCNFCGFCSGYVCYMYSKASPNVNILPALRQVPNFELRPNAHVLRVNLDDSKRKATGVTYIDAQGREVEQPAELVILAAFQFNNVRLMLLSGIGKPYDPVKNEGVVGRNFAYQNMGTVKAFFDKNTYTNNFIGAGGNGIAIDDFNADNFDHGPHGFVGGSPMWVNQAGSRDCRHLQPARYAGLGQCLEENHGRLLHPPGVDGRPRCAPVLPCQLPGPGPHLPRRLRPAAVAHDLRLAGKRHQDEPVHGRQAEQDRSGDEPQGHCGAGQAGQGPLQHRQLPDYPPERRCDHGHRPQDQCSEPLPAKLGRT